MPSSCFGWINPFSTTKNAYMIPGDSNATLTPSEETRVILVEITKKIRSRHDVEP